MLHIVSRRLGWTGQLQVTRKVVQYETELRPHKHLPKINLYRWPHCPLSNFDIEGDLHQLHTLTFLSFIA